MPDAGTVSVVRIGVVILPEHRWSVARELWMRAEDLGFEHAWTYDHLAWRTLRDSPWFAAIPTMLAAATATERIRLGPLVASPNFRHPVPFAKELMTLDDVSGGRLTVGIGAGGYGWDSTMLGQPELSRRARADRFEEFVTLTDRLLREPETTHHGHHYTAEGARSIPGCVQRPRPPFAIAATGPRGMHLAARQADTWVTIGDPAGGEHLDPTAGAAVVARQSEMLEAACTEVRRDPVEVARLVLTGTLLDGGLASPQAFDEVVGRYSEVGVTDLVVHWPRDSEPYRGDRRRFEQIFSR